MALPDVDTPLLCGGTWETIGCFADQVARPTVTYFVVTAEAVGINAYTVVALAGDQPPTHFDQSCATADVGHTNDAGIGCVDGRMSTSREAKSHGRAQTFSPIQSHAFVHGRRCRR